MVWNATKCVALVCTMNKKEEEHEEQEEEGEKEEETGKVDDGIWKKMLKIMRTRYSSSNRSRRGGGGERGR